MKVAKLTNFYLFSGCWIFGCNHAKIILIMKGVVDECSTSVFFVVSLIVQLESKC